MKTALTTSMVFDKRAQRISSVTTTLFVIIALFTATVISLSIQSNQALAKDLGVRGQTYKIVEEDPVEHIKRKLSSMEQSGELEEHKKTIQNKTKEKLRRPTPVKGITTATEDKTFYHDPTFVLQEDIKDHLGNVIHRAGKSFNPLDTMPMRINLLFIDGEITEQVDYALDQYKQRSSAVTIILIKGSPIELERQHDIPIYFDQLRELTTKFSITKVPSMVSQESNRLKIQEVTLEKKK